MDTNNYEFMNLKIIINLYILFWILATMSRNIRVSLIALDIEKNISLSVE